MTNSLFNQVLAERGERIDDVWVLAWIAKIDQLPVFAESSYSFAMLFAKDPNTRQFIFEHVQASYETKPYGCVLCEEKPATTYHCYAGRVCPDCCETLPKS